jgi:RNA polymerase-interacting CarD/CdnL/TRCF family regulator
MGIVEADLKVGDRVVYPNQGVCRVAGTTDMEIAGQRQTFVKLAREDDGATVLVPAGRLDKVGLRRVADQAELERIFRYLAAPVEGPELDWKVRHRTHGERMSEGGLMGLAQVVKGLTTLADLRPLPPKERELYDNARHLLVSEIAAGASLPEVSAEDAVDLALFPPGKERKKPALKVSVLPEEGGEELDLGEEEAVGMDLDALGGEEAAAAAEEPKGEEEGVSEAAAKRARGLQKLRSALEKASKPHADKAARSSRAPKAAEGKKLEKKEAKPKGPPAKARTAPRAKTKAPHKPKPKGRKK